MDIPRRVLLDTNIVNFIPDWGEVVGCLQAERRRRTHMTKLALLAYPVLADSEQRWIEGIRARHDPQARRIRACFTHVSQALERGNTGVVHHSRSDRG
jgi:hypothetical protein